MQVSQSFILYFYFYLGNLYFLFEWREREVVNISFEDSVQQLLECLWQ